MRVPDRSRVTKGPVVILVGLLMLSGHGHAVGADQYCTDVESPVGLCDDREHAYAQLHAHLQ